MCGRAGICGPLGCGGAGLGRLKPRWFAWQVHALNILRHVFLDTSLAKEVPPSRLGSPPPLAPLPPWPPSRLGRRRPRGGPSSATMAATTRPAARARSTVPGPCGGEADPPRRGGAPQLLMYGPARRLALPRRGWAPLPPRSAAQATAGRRGEAAHAAAVGRWGGGRSVAMRRWGGGAVGR